MFILSLYQFVAESPPTRRLPTGSFKSKLRARYRFFPNMIMSTAALKTALGKAPAAYVDKANSILILVKTRWMNKQRELENRRN